MRMWLVLQLLRLASTVTSSPTSFSSVTCMRLPVVMGSVGLVEFSQAEGNGDAVTVEEAAKTSSGDVVWVFDTSVVDLPSSPFAHDPTIVVPPSDGFTLDPEKRTQL